MAIKRSSRFRWLPVLVSVVGMLSFSPASAQVAPETCFGEEVTVFWADRDKPTQGDDVIMGTDDFEVIFGRGGNDLICGGGGGDLIYGGAGDDRIRGGGGNDTIVGGAGSDQLFGGAGNDILDAATLLDDGEGDSDRLNGGSGGDQCEGGTKQSGCEPPCIDDEAIPGRIGISRAYISISSSADQGCHFGTSGLLVKKDVARSGQKNVVKEIPRIASADSTTKLSRIKSLKAGQTLTITFVNQERPCKDNGRVTESVQVHAVTPGAYGLDAQIAETEFVAPACGLSYVTSIQDGSP